MEQIERDILIESLAKYEHERWVTQRISDGWQYGVIRDDNKKESPNIIPYEELSRCEQEYDIATANRIIEAIEGMGFSIIRR